MAEEFKTKQRPQQKEAHEFLKRRRKGALFMGMRTGKSKVIIDDAARLYREGTIDTLIIVAPNGVHSNWVINQFPEHMPDDIKYIADWYESAMGVKRKDRWHRALCATDKLRCITFHMESMSIKSASYILTDLIVNTKCMLVIDESHGIKNNTTKAAKFAIKWAKHAICRRILTGTSISEGPLDLWPQFMFLDPKIFPPGLRRYPAFRRRFAVIERVQLKKETVEQRQKANPGRKQRDFFEHVVAFKNLAQLEKLVSPHCYHAVYKKSDKQPAPVYEKIYVDMTAEQKRHYKKIVKDSYAELEPVAGINNVEDLLIHYAEGKVDRMTAKNAMTKILRLQQVLSGHFTVDDTGEIISIDNNRVDTLVKAIEGIHGKIIIWSRFNLDHANITGALEAIYGEGSVVQYYGEIPKKQRPAIIHQFQTDTKIRFFVGNPKCGGVGVELDAADTTIYYSNNYSMVTREQSEARPVHIDKVRPLLYLDLEVRGSVDEKILRRLKEKKGIADGFNFNADQE